MTANDKLARYLQSIQEVLFADRDAADNMLTSLQIAVNGSDNLDDAMAELEVMSEE